MVSVHIQMIRKQLKSSSEGKIVLITGGSSEIGADSARHLAKLGAKVTTVGINEQKLNKVTEEIKSAGCN